MTKETQDKYFYSIGRRKESSATVKMYPGKKGIKVNNKLLEDYFQTHFQKEAVFSPLKLTGNLDKFEILVTARGGGLQGQAEAVSLGIARGLVKFSSDLKTTLKKGGFLKRDPREKERKKCGLKKARKKPQSPKR